MRVLHVIEAMHLGGAESMVIEHCRHARDFAPLVCALNRGGPALEQVQALGVPATLLAKAGGAGGRAAAVRRLADLMRHERVTVVNGHNPVGSLYATAAATMARVPMVRTEHSLHYRGRHSGAYPAIEALGTWLARRVVCVCDAVRESHARRLPWARQRFVTVRNGVSDAPPPRGRDEARRALGLDPDAPVALTVGSLTTQKAQHVLIDAFARIAAARPGAVVLIAGDGPLREALAAQARAAAPEGSVRFLGARGDVADLLAAADLFVLSSVREGLSITLLEAMRASRPIVATRIGGNGEAVSDGATGWLVPASDPPTLAAAIEAAFADPARARAFGVAGRARWVECFTAERMVRETEAVYRGVLDGAAGEPVAALAGAVP
jgi:glycosyltransferase involved in cell wall biosynthesis